MLKKFAAKLAKSKVLKGKVTHTALAGILAIVLGQAFGVPVAEGDVALALEGILALVGVVGRIRAELHKNEPQAE